MNIPERPLNPPEPPEPKKTDIDCNACGRTLLENDEYQQYTDYWSDRQIIICEDCYVNGRTMYAEADEEEIDD